MANVPGPLTQPPQCYFIKLLITRDLFVFLKIQQPTAMLYMYLGN